MLSDDTINLVPWTNTISAVGTILKYWDRLLIATSAATLPGAPDISQFSESCLLFSAIETSVPIAKPEVKPTSELQTGAWSDKPTTQLTHIGCLFLATTAYEHELSLGIILKPKWTGKGYGARACELALRTAFESFKFHRVSAVILDSPDSFRTQQFFANMGFSHEGTRRRGVYSYRHGEWMDATYMAMVDTAWLVRTQNETISKKQTLWDTLFARQEKERDELMRFEERASSKPKVEIDDNIPETPTFPATSDPPLWVDATFDPPPLQLATDHTAPGGPAPLPLNRSRLRIKRKRARKERQDSGVASRAESREEGQPMNTEDETQPRAADQGQELCFKNWGLALSQELDPLASNFRELAVSDSGSDVGTVRSWDLVSEGESFGSPRRSGSSLDAGSVSGSEDSWDHLRNEVDSMDLWDNMVIPPPSDVVAHPAEELQPPVQGDIHCRDCDCRLGSKHDVYHGGSGDCSNDIFLNPVDWMAPMIIPGTNTGNIYCPNVLCGSTVGAYRLSGASCSGCQGRIVPAHHVWASGVVIT